MLKRILSSGGLLSAESMPGSAAATRRNNCKNKLIINKRLKLSNQKWDEIFPETTVLTEGVGLASLVSPGTISIHRLDRPIDLASNIPLLGFGLFPYRTSIGVGNRLISGGTYDCLSPKWSKKIMSGVWKQNTNEHLRDPYKYLKSC